MRTRSAPSGTVSRSPQPFSSDDASRSGVSGAIDLDIGKMHSDCARSHGLGGVPAATRFFGLAAQPTADASTQAQSTRRQSDRPNDRAHDATRRGVIDDKPDKSAR